MKLWRAYLLSALLLSPISLKADLASFNQFSGINTDDSPLLLTGGQTPDSENVITDDGPGLQGRKGFVAFATQTAVGMWEFPKSDGTRYLIANTGSRLLADTGSGTFSTLVSTVPSDRTVAASVLGDRFYFADTTNGLKYWDGTSVFIATAALKVDKLVTWKGRLVAAGLAASQRQIYLSKLNDGTSWTAPANPSDDDAATITVTGALDENIQGLFSSFKDLLIWFKKNSFGGIYGSRRSNFSQRTFSDYIGVASPETVRDCDGYLRWLGNNRVIWEFDGATYKKISEQVDTLFAPIAQGDSSAKSNTQTTQTQFELGTQTPTGFADTASVPGTLMPKTTYFIDTNQADFQAGTCNPVGNCQYTSDGFLHPYLMDDTVSSQAEWSAGTYDNTVYVDTETSPGTLQTTYPDTFSTFRQGSGTKNVWTSALCDGLPTSNIGVSGGQLQLYTTYPASGGGSNDCYIRTVAPTHDLSGGATFFWQVSSATIQTTNISYIFCLSTNPATNGTNLTVGNNIYGGWYGAGGGLTFTSITGRKNGTINFSYSPSLVVSWPADIKLIITSSKWEVWINGVFRSSGTHTMTLSSYYFFFVNNPTSITYPTPNGCTIDNFSIAPETFTYTMTGRDSGAFSSTWSTFTATTNSTSFGASTETFTTAASSDNVTFDAGVSVLSGAVPTSATKRYLRVATTFNHNPSTFPAAVASLSDYRVLGFSTYTFTSRTFDTGMVPPVWGTFFISTNNSGGTQTFFTQASSDGSSFDSQVSASSGTQVTSATKRYIRYIWNEIPASVTVYDSAALLGLTGKSTGTFISQPVQIGSQITTWGQLAVAGDVTTGSYTIAIATSTNGVSFSSFTIVANNAIPAVPVAPYIETRIIFSVTSATQTPTVTDIVINWTEGSTIRSASAYINQRYWLGVAVSSTSNNRVFVFDKNRQWQRYSGINMDCTTLYNSKLYFGNSAGIFQAENGYSDNNASITSYFRTATVALGALDSYFKFDRLFTTTDASDSTLTATFQVDGINTNYALGAAAMNATTGIQSLKFPFPISQVQEGRLLNLKWSVPGTAFWRILNSNLYYDRDTVPY